METLKYLANYDDVIATHLEKVENDHSEMEEKKKGSKKGDKIRRFKRGSKLTFMSNDIQNKLIDIIISKEIALEIVSLIKGSAVWALIADTTPVCIGVVSKSGKVSEHLLFCTRALSTTAEQLLNHIADEFERSSVSCDNLVAQTYNGASNMSGRYNGLQAKFKELAGEEHIIFVHCYAHTLKLVLGDTANASLDFTKLFENLQALYVMISKSQPIHQLFEDCQEEMQLPIRPLKCINTVRWSAREYCLDIFLKRYDSVMFMPEKITDSIAFDANRRNTADGMRNLFSTKQFMASAYLFWEIFAMTGPLSHILHGANIYFGKALNLLDAALE